jgi:hypothetical protein
VSELDRHELHRIRYHVAIGPVIGDDNVPGIEVRIVQEITSWNEVAGAESAKPRLTMNSNQPWRRRLRHSHPPACFKMWKLFPGRS